MIIKNKCRALQRSFILSVLALFPMHSFAAGQYLLPKLGFMSIELNSADPLLSVGVLYGYGLDDRIAVESEFNLGFSGGEYAINSGTPDTGDYRIWTVAAYGVYRFPIAEASYIKTKLGLLYENVELRSKQFANQEDDDTGIAGGIGFGSRINNSLTLELEATVIDEDIIFYSAGFHYQF